jgi:multiple sugar transport system ATP-binding protein
MNFIHGTIERSAGAGVRLADGSVLPAPNAPIAAETREVVIGVRPERLAIDPKGVPAEVVVVEPTGMDTQIYCTLAGTEVAAVVRERHAFRPGEEIRLAPRLTYLFDPGSGERIRQ